MESIRGGVGTDGKSSCDLGSIDFQVYFVSNTMLLLQEFPMEIGRLA